MRLTVARARAQARALGFSLRRNAWGEWRLAPLAGTPAEREAQASYCDTVADALDNAKADAARRRVNADAARQAVAASAGRVDDPAVQAFIRLLAQRDADDGID